jgi:hypothetical protein
LTATISVAGGVSGTNGTFADAIGTLAGFNYPWGVAVVPGGNILVADLANNRIRRITPFGSVTTISGGVQGSTGAFSDGSGTQVGYNQPIGVAVDARGHLIISDYLNVRIRQMTPAGVVTTIAGNAAGGSADGIGVNAGFRGPLGVAVGANGNIVVADNTNQVIRVLAPPSGRPSAFDVHVFVCVYVCMCDYVCMCVSMGACALWSIDSGTSMFFDRTVFLRY